MKKVFNFILIGTLLLSQSMSIKLKQNSSYSGYNAYTTKKSKLDSNYQTIYDKGLENLKIHYDGVNTDATTSHDAQTGAINQFYSDSKTNYNDRVKTNDESLVKLQEAADLTYNQGTNALKQAHDDSVNAAQANHDDSVTVINNDWSATENNYAELNKANDAETDKIKLAVDAAYNAGVQAYKDTYNQAKTSSDTKSQARQTTLKTNYP